MESGIFILGRRVESNRGRWKSKERDSTSFNTGRSDDRPINGQIRQADYGFARFGDGSLQFPVRLLPLRQS